MHPLLSKLHSLRDEINALDDEIAARITAFEDEVRAWSPGISFFIASVTGFRILWRKLDGQWRFVAEDDDHNTPVLSLPRDQRLAVVTVLTKELLLASAVKALEAAIAERRQVLK